ncbi:L-serine ammonia-lyase [Noviherbaspirillum sp.]|jgi:L-serine dehydratase|uniref:L-serine ammonia-lyase n=1 Tax=Noviherbaspirillum sp. TaxID=1926288 RepID=UPI0025EE1C32|nr:L-serine ammonia-lyase [Noviherbaspirillum sp.]
MPVSVFEIFKIGIGPSSSHTVGPMCAARQFAQNLEAGGLLGQVGSVTVDLYGSLALTGTGHGTDRAILLGLAGKAPETVDVDSIGPTLAAIRQSGTISLLGKHLIPFSETSHLLFHMGRTLPQHPNGMRFTASDTHGRLLLQQLLFSIGGGFVVSADEIGKPVQSPVAWPHPYRSAQDMLRIGRERNMSIAALAFENEQALRSERDIIVGIDRIRTTMRACIERGLKQEGTLPGGLNVRRRARHLHERLLEKKNVQPLQELDWVNAFAVAVNEENAAGGRVVTAPTNGAAGIIPAVLRFYEQFCDNASTQGMRDFLLTAAAIGSLYKENASISGAEVGCQGEVGVAASMAAAGLAAALGGTNEQIENAAEIGMEHNLGLTCDPIGGLVQIPCIERNAMGATKAINAARLALCGDGTHHVSLDKVIETMRQTGADMHSKYKETSLGGLAVSVVAC